MNEIVKKTLTLTETNREAEINEETKFCREKSSSVKLLPLNKGNLERITSFNRNLAELVKISSPFNRFAKNNAIEYIEDPFTKNYEEKEIIGEGSQGVVKKVINKLTNNEYAAKIIRKSDLESLSHYNKEFEMMKSLNHPNIVTFNEMIIRENYSDIIFIMELIEKCPMLNDLIHCKITQNEEITKKITKQILKGLEYLHNLGICHRDIKPSNIFVSEDGEFVKLIDFETSTYYKHDNNNKVELWSPAGTNYYKSPEQITSKADEKSDIYAVGLILYEMITLKKPFGKKKGNKLLKLMESQNFDMENEMFKLFNPNVKTLILKLLTCNPDNRISANEALQHEWFL